MCSILLFWVTSPNTGKENDRVTQEPNGKRGTGRQGLKWSKKRAGKQTKGGNEKQNMTDLQNKQEITEPQNEAELIPCY